MRKTKKLFSVLLTFCMVLSLFAIGAVPTSADTGGYASVIQNGILHMEAWVTPNATGTVEVDRALQSSYTFTVTFKTYTWYATNGYPYMAQVITPDNAYYMWYTYGQVSSGVPTTAPTVYNGVYFENTKLLDNATSSVTYTAPAPAVGETSGPYTFKTWLRVFDSNDYTKYVTIEATRDVYLKGVCSHTGHTSTQHNGSQHYSYCDVCGETWGYADHTDRETGRTAATCVSGGTVYHRCDTCGYEWTTGLGVDPNNHASGQYYDGTPATCTAPGYEAGWYCSACGTWYSGHGTIGQIDHIWGTYAHVEDGDDNPANDRHAAPCTYNCGTTNAQPCSFTDTVYPSTCTDQGFTRHTCSVCDYSYDDTLTPKKDHVFNVYVEEVTPAACAANATATYRCATCTATTVKEVPGSQLTHNWQWITDEQPTCGAPGKKHQQCEYCNAVQSENTVIAPTGEHVFEWVTDEEPTCGAPGKKHEACKNCDAVQSENTPIDPTGAHEWEWVTDTAPGCATQGVRHEKCKNCGAVQSENTVIEPTGAHEWEWVIDTEATCGDPGVKHEECKNCDAVQSENTVIEPTGNHTYGDDDWTPAIFADCGNDGVLAHFECSVCHRLFDLEGEELTSVVDPATGDHDWEWATDVEPGCYTDGVKHQFCTVCEQTQAEGTPIPAAHEFDDWVAPTAPGCGSDGNVGYYHCHVCGDDFDADGNLLETVVVPATGAHVFEWVTDEEPTCGAPGVKHEKCKNCDAVQSENTPIDPTGAHVFEWVTDEEPTCGEPGKKHEACKNCDAVQSENTAIAPTGTHVFEWVTDEEPTCGEPGKKHEACKNCDAVQNENTPIDPTGAHVFEWVIDEEPTCGDPGVKHEKCKNCDAVQSENTPIDPTGAHVFEWVIDEEPTCGEPGKKHEACKNCDAVQNENTPIDPTGEHVFEWVTDEEPTCGDPGKKHEACKNCDAVQSENTPIDPTGEHVFEWVTDEEPTCGTPGVKHEKCKNCDAVQNENTPIAPTGAHVFEWVTDEEPTCGEPGKKHEACKNCDAVQSENTPIAPTGAHVFEWVIDEEPTCGAPGKKHEACKNCDAVQSENTPIAPTGAHVFEWVIDEEPTCGAPGKKHEACKNCDATQSENTPIDPTGAHSFTVYQSTVPATCIAKGYDVYQCAACDATENRNYTEGFDENNHVGEREIRGTVTATCTAEGYSGDTYCLSCGNIIVPGENTGYGAHVLTKTDAVLPTCKDTGFAAYWSCSECGQYFLSETAETPLTREQLDAQGVIGTTDDHTPGEAERENEVAAGCTTDGSYEEVICCAVCGEELSRETKTDPAKGHRWGDWQIVVPATEDEEGLAKRVCSACGEEETKTITEMGEPVTKTVKFVNLSGMHYELDLGDGETYTIYNSSTVQWLSNTPLKFKVVTYSGFAFPEIIVRANGVELSPDADGCYSLPQTADTVIVTVEGAVQDNSAPNGRLSFWELLIRFFRQIIAFFTGVFGNNKIC